MIAFEARLRGAVSINPLEQHLQNFVVPVFEVISGVWASREENVFCESQQIVKFDQIIQHQILVGAGTSLCSCCLCKTQATITETGTIFHCYHSLFI